METGIADFRDYSCVQLPSITFINQIHTCLPLLTSRHVQCKSLDRNLIRLTYLCCHSLQLVLRMYCQYLSMGFRQLILNTMN